MPQTAENVFCYFTILLFWHFTICGDKSRKLLCCHFTISFLCHFTMCGDKNRKFLCCQLTMCGVLNKKLFFLVNILPRVMQICRDDLLLSRWSWAVRRRQRRRARLWVPEQKQQTKVRSTITFLIHVEQKQRQKCLLSDKHNFAKTTTDF